MENMRENEQLFECDGYKFEQQEIEILSALKEKHGRIEVKVLYDAPVNFVAFTLPSPRTVEAYFGMLGEDQTRLHKANQMIFDACVKYPANREDLIASHANVVNDVAQAALTLSKGKRADSKKFVLEPKAK